MSGFAAYTFVAIALVFALVLVLPPGDAHAQANTVSFSDTPYTREIPENTAANTSVGSPVRATDADGDTLTHSLGGTDADSFDIISSSGRIQTKVGVTYDYEAKSSYSVTVTADDGKGGTASTTGSTCPAIQKSIRMVVAALCRAVGGRSCRMHESSCLPNYLG